MAVRSKRLGLVESMTLGVYKDVFTVPAGRTAIVKEWSVANWSGEARSVTLFVRSGALLARVGFRQAMATWTVWDSPERFLVLHPGDALVALATDGTGSNLFVSVLVSGALLDGAPT